MVKTEEKIMDMRQHTGKVRKIEQDGGDTVLHIRLSKSALRVADSSENMGSMEVAYQ